MSEPQIVTTKNSKTHNWKKVILTVVIIIVVSGILVAAYWFLFLNKTTDDSDLTGPVPKVNTKQSTKSAKKATESAKKETTQVKTAGWATFNSKKIGYTVKLPKTWLTTVGAENKLCVENLDFWGPTKDLLGVCASEFGGMVVVTKINQDYSSYVKDFDSSYLKNSKTTKTTVGGKEATRISGTYTVPMMDVNSLNGSKEIKYLINQDDKVLSITYLQKPEWTDYSEEFDLIISTLNFL